MTREGSNTVDVERIRARVQPLVGSVVGAGALASFLTPTDVIVLLDLYEGSEVALRESLAALREITRVEPISTTARSDVTEWANALDRAQWIAEGALARLAQEGGAAHQTEGRT